MNNYKLDLYDSSAEIQIYYDFCDAYDARHQERKLEADFDLVEQTILFWEFVKEVTNE